MTRKLLKTSGLLLLFGLLFLACRTDADITNTDDNTNSAITFRSLWKEDEVYITNVKEIFEKDFDQQYFSTNFGTVNWDYAMTMGKFDESYLIAPIIKNGNVVSTMHVKRNKATNKVYFSHTENHKDLSFFQTLIYVKAKKNPVPDKLLDDGNPTGKLTCVTRTIEVGCVSGYEDCIPLLSSTTSCTDDGSGGSGLPGPILPLNNGDDGNDGHDYPHGGGNTDGDTNQEDPCENLKAKLTKENFKNTLEKLNKSSVFNAKKETGFSENKSGSFMELKNAASTESSDGLKIIITADIIGYIHAHLNDRETGKTNDDGAPIEKRPIRMFSPADVNALMEIAKLATGSYADIYGAMVSSSGNYIIKFSGTASDIQTGFDSETWRNEFVKFKEKNEFYSLEKLFLTFLKDKMKVNGIDLYKLKDNGTIQRKTLNSSNKVDSKDCPK